MKTEKEIKKRLKEELYVLSDTINKCKDKDEAYWKGYGTALKWVLEKTS